MALREKFGKLVLLEKLDEGPLAAIFRAARVSPSGLERIVALHRYSDAVSKHPDAAPRLMEQARAASRLQVPGLVRVLGIGRVAQAYYSSHELVEGRVLRKVIDRAHEERFPFAAENALMVASRAAAVLESLHGREDGKGRPLAHGLVCPAHLVLSWEGEVRVTGLGLWPSLRGTALLGDAERRYLAPEQAAGEAGDALSDVYSLAVVLLETLHGRPPEGSDPLETLASARFVTATGEEEPLPAPLEQLLGRALAPDPALRHGSMGELRQAIDTLLFSGDFTPTTFNLAYFVQTLFRVELEREAATLAEERQADYSEFVPAPEPAPTDPETPAASADATGPEHVAVADQTPSWPPPSPPRPRPRGPEASSPAASGRGVRSRVRAEGSGRAFARAAPATRSRRGLALVGGLVLAVLLGGGIGYLYFVKLRPLSATTSAATLSPDGVAAMARVRELEAQLAALQREKAEAERQAREVLESGPAAPGAIPASEVSGGVDQAEAAAEAAAQAAATRARRRARAREDARRQALAEQARREAEILRLEEEMRVAEAVLVAEHREPEGTSPVLPAILPPPPTPVPAPPPVVPGELVSIDDPAVTGPVLVSEGDVRYPLAAQRAQRESLVLVEALVDQAGSVLEARVLEASVAGYGFEKAAIERVRQNRYRPAIKRGVPVRVRIQVPVRFRIGR